LARELLEQYQDGGIKLWVTHAALLARRKNPELFRRADYEALPSGDHLVAFIRSYGKSRLICCAARLSLSHTEGPTAWATGGVWGNRTLKIPEGRYRDVLTDRVIDVRGSLPLAELLDSLPIAMLMAED
jgi:(1->4)-alpha-D-glucan 1-alpha-D-glucosylmutase